MIPLFALGLALTLKLEASDSLQQLLKHCHSQSSRSVLSSLVSDFKGIEPQISESGAQVITFISYQSEEANLETVFWDRSRHFHAHSVVKHFLSLEGIADSKLKGAGYVILEMEPMSARLKKIVIQDSNPYFMDVLKIRKLSLEDLADIADRIWVGPFQFSPETQIEIRWGAFNDGQPLLMSFKDFQIWIEKNRRQSYKKAG